MLVNHEVFKTVQYYLSSHELEVKREATYVVGNLLYSWDTDSIHKLVATKALNLADFFNGLVTL